MNKFYVQRCVRDGSWLVVHDDRRFVDSVETVPQGRYAYKDEADADCYRLNVELDKYPNRFEFTAPRLRKRAVRVRLDEK